MTAAEAQAAADSARSASAAAATASRDAKLSADAAKDPKKKAAAQVLAQKFLDLDQKAKEADALAKKTVVEEDHAKAHPIEAALTRVQKTAKKVPWWAWLAGATAVSAGGIVLLLRRRK